MAPLDAVRVLVVEDAKDIRDVFTLLLGVEGAEVTAAATGREAVELAMQRDFDVLLTDLGLPDIPGDVVIGNVVATARRRPWIVVVTGYGEPFAAPRSRGRRGCPLHQAGQLDGPAQRARTRTGVPSGVSLR